MARRDSRAPAAIGARPGQSGSGALAGEPGVEPAERRRAISAASRPERVAREDRRRGLADRAGAHAHAEPLDAAVASSARPSASVLPQVGERASPVSGSVSSGGQSASSTASAEQLGRVERSAAAIIALLAPASPALFACADARCALVDQLHHRFGCWR